MALDREKVLAALRTVQDPELFKDIVTLNMVKDVRVDGPVVHVTVELTTPACPLKEKIEKDVRNALLNAGAEDVRLTITANTRGPAGPSTPCASSRMGRLPTTRQIKSPSAGRLVSNPFFLRFSSKRYSLPSGLTRTLKHSFGESSTGARINFCLTVGSITVGLIQPSFSLHQAQKCCGRPLPT